MYGGQVELDFQKHKQKIAALSDRELVGRSRDPNASATERMLIEAEISRRGLDRRSPPPASTEPPQLAKRSSGLFSAAVIIVILFSIISGVLDQLGIDLIEMLREFFADRGTTELIPG